MVWAEIALVPIASAFLDQQARPFSNLSEFFALSAESEAAFEHVSSWVDCTAGGASLGRGVMFRANWSAVGGLSLHQAKPRLGIPMEAPTGLMNGLTLRAFNAAYLARHRLGADTARVHYASGFHPFDAIGGWNRLYGARGFYQHQFVVPPDSQESAVAEVLSVIAASGQGSFLAVLKTLGPGQSGGLVSFHGPGTSLALDFPNRGAATLALLERLDQIVAAAGGRVYPAKDGRMSPAVFQAGYPLWRELERQRDPLFSSGFWRRVTQ